MTICRSRRSIWVRTSSRVWQWTSMYFPFVFFGGLVSEGMRLKAAQ
ncbi:hypothetical protein EMIT0P176_20089 [Pseudomonas sp. IT-P176]